MTDVTHPLARRVIAGDVPALARACRLVDDAVGEYRTILKQLFPHTGHAWTIGITGMPGAGKSTLTDKLIRVFRAQQKKVAVVAIDPTSPFSGGAILGDRIRMQSHHLDEGVFIRSLATRGALGGLSRSAADVIRVVDAWKADVVLVETVGVGQDELEVTRTVDSTLVVTAPGMGDEVQAIKAGILECADTFAVNKADRDGADITVRDLELMVAMGQSLQQKPASRGHAGHLSHAGAAGKCGPVVRPTSGVQEGPWLPPVVKSIATQSVGIDELVSALERHRTWLMRTEAGSLRRMKRLREAMHNQLRNTLIAQADSEMHAAIEEAVTQVASKQIDPYTAAELLVARFKTK